LRNLLLSIAALMLAPLPTLAGDILLVQGSRSNVLEQVSRLLQNDCAAGSRTLVLSDYADPDLARQVREQRPSMVVAIGDSALAETKKLRNIRVVYGLALNVSEETLGNNISGVSMMVSPASYMKLFSALGLKRIGTIHDRKLTGAYVSRARAAAEQMGIELVPLRIGSSMEVPQKLAELRNRKIDALWLLADTTAITPETVDSYFNFAQLQNLPVISFSSAYLTKGALASLEVTRREMGRQICTSIKAGRSAGEGTVSDPSRGKLLFNDAVAKRLSISLPPVSRLSSELLLED